MSLEITLSLEVLTVETERVRGGRANSDSRISGLAGA
jgi:hypothetical protein